MPAIENVTRRGAVYWWRRRMRFVAGDHAPITITVTASLQTKEQATARQRAVAMTGRSEVIRMSLYEKIERKGLSADQAQLLFQAEVVRYRNMLAYQHTSIQTDGDGNVDARLTQMLAIYEAANSDFARQGFAGYMDVDYVGAFDERFAELDRDARRHLFAMLSRLDDVPGNLLNEAADALQRAGIADDDERRQLARRIVCEARATAVRLYRDEDAQRVVAAASGMAALMPRPNVTAAPPISAPAPTSDTVKPLMPEPGFGSEGRKKEASELTVEQARFARMTPTQAVEEYMRSKPKTGGLGSVTGNALVVHQSSVTPAPVGRKKSSPKIWGDSQRRQFRAAAFLFGKSNNGRPLSTARQDDLVDLYDAFNRMPSSHHKSPRHEKMTLEEICAEAEQQMSDGTPGPTRSGWTWAPSTGTSPT